MKVGTKVSAKIGARKPIDGVVLGPSSLRNTMRVDLERLGVWYVPSSRLTEIPA